MTLDQAVFVFDEGWLFGAALITCFRAARVEITPARWRQWVGQAAAKSDLGQAKAGIWGENRI
jgi:hypothetical protein